MRFIDNFLNNITMYRLVVYGLGILALIAIMLASFGRLAFSPGHMVISLALLLTASYVTDRVLGDIWQVPRNSESWLITGLILFLIITPVSTVSNVVLLFTAGVIASGSKFILAVNGKHIFNPAAFAASTLSLTALLPASWWVGTSALWPYELIIGLLIVRKIRRFPLVLTFVAVSLVLQVYIFISHGIPLIHNMQNAIIASPLIFLSTIMLTEPATMPPRRNQQVLFGALIAVLYTTAWKIGPLNIYPEVALLIGNLFAYAGSPTFSTRLQLKAVEQVSDRVYHYIFAPDKRFSFLPGQYMEWTLAGVPYDSRGNRRTFTIASSPTEETVQLGLKYYDPPSTYKYVFSRLQPGDWIYASQLAGNFTLQGHEAKKLVFIAGGIGITPFRSMIKYLTDLGQQADIVLLYMVSDPQEFAYLREFREARDIGLKFIPVVTRTDLSMEGVVSAKPSAELIARLVPDYQERRFYISGPNVMVDTTKRYLLSLQIPRSHIKTDHFSGY